MVRSLFAFGMAAFLFTANPVRAQQAGGDKEELIKLRAEVEKLKKELEAERAKAMAEPPRKIGIRRNIVDVNQFRRVVRGPAVDLDQMRQLAQILADSNIDLQALMKMVEQQKAGRKPAEPQPKLPTDPA